MISEMPAERPGMPFWRNSNLWYYLNGQDNHAMIVGLYATYERFLCWLLCRLKCACAC